MTEMYTNLCKYIEKKKKKKLNSFLICCLRNIMLISVHYYCFEDKSNINNDFYVINSASKTLKKIRILI